MARLGEGRRDSASRTSTSDSNEREHLDAKHERDREQRIEGIERRVEYGRSEPPETWGPQQNAVVNRRLDAVRSV
jgi:hypothetical protein